MKRNKTKKQTKGAKTLAEKVGVEVQKRR